MELCRSQVPKHDLYFSKHEGWSYRMAVRRGDGLCNRRSHNAAERPPAATRYGSCARARTMAVELRRREDRAQHSDGRAAGWWGTRRMAIRSPGPGGGWLFLRYASRQCAVVSVAGARQRAFLWGAREPATRRRRLYRVRSSGATVLRAVVEFVSRPGRAVEWVAAAGETVRAEPYCCAGAAATSDAVSAAAAAVAAASAAAVASAAIGPGTAIPVSRGAASGAATTVNV